MTWLRKFLKIKPSKRTIYTLDRDGGLIVSRDLLLRSHVMDRQIKAAKALYDVCHSTDTPAATPSSFLNAN